MKKPFILAVFLFLLAVSAHAQDSATHARQVLDLLRQGKFEEITKQFNAQMTAGLTAEKLSQTWSAVKMQVGEFKSEIDQRVQNVGPVAIVTLGCQFERAALNTVIVFEGDKIAGLQLVPRPPDLPTVSVPAGLTEEAVTVGSGAFALPGTLTLPQGSSRVPAVVLVHGSGPQDRDSTLGPNKPFRDLAWGLASRGIAVLRYEKRTNVYAEKMAANANITVKEETIEDAVLAAQVLRKHARVDASRVFVLGHSLGGMVAPRIAKEDGTLAGLVVLAGSSRPLQELVVEQAEYIAALSGDPKEQTAVAEVKRQVAKINDPDLPLSYPAVDLLGVPASYWKDLNASKPGAVAATLKLPMLILQGERDYQVTMKDFELWRESLKGRTNVTFKSYPNLNHLFIAGTGKAIPAEYQKPGKVADAVLDDIAAWIKKN